MDTQFSQAGLRVYFAERLLEPGGKLSEQLSDALQRSNTFVAIVGPHFSTSNWPIRELAMAQQRPPADYPSIIPVVISDAHVPLALAAYQTIRLADPTDDAELSQVVAQIVNLVRRSGSAADGTVAATETAPAAADGGDDGAEVNGIGIWGYRDRPAKKDALKRQKIVEVVAAMLSDGQTTDNQVAPASADPERRGQTVLALEGAWGTGKTTMMDHIEAKLDERWANATPTFPPPPRRLRAWRADLALSGWPRWSKVWDDSMRPTVNARTPATVRFEPWTYQTGEQVWAGLATTLLDAAKKTIEWHPRARERYWFQRNAERLDTQQLQRSLRRRILSPLFRVGVFALMIPIVSQLARATDTDYTWGDIAIAGVNVALLIPTILLLAALLHTAARMFRPVATMLPTELFQQPVLSTTLSPAAIPKTDPALRDPYYRAQAGYLYLLQHDVFDVLHDIGHELIVFIDDLDRCGAKTTADVFEAINMFLTRHFPTTRFVLGLDAAAVVAHLDDTYSALANQQQIRGDADPTVGWSYLRKLIQLQIPVPGITQELVPDILASLLNVDPSGVPPADGDAATNPSGQVLASVEAGQSSPPPPTVAMATRATPGTGSSEPVKPVNVQTLERDRNVRALLTEVWRLNPIYPFARPRGS